MNYSTSKKILFTSFSLSFILLIFSACGSYEPQTLANVKTVSNASKDPIHTFYIAGGAGNAITSEVKTQQLLQSYLDKAKKESTLLYVGDYTSEVNENEAINKALLQKHLDLTKNFKGKTYFTLGDNEWASFDAETIEWVENYIKDNDIKRTEVEPNNVCPLEYREISDNLDMILVDSQWYISNWDRVEDINRKCTDITTRRRFVEELEGAIKDARGKNLIIVMHHPLFSNGTYASAIGGFSPKYGNFDRYYDLRIQVSSLAQELDNVTVVSGHDESLQYLKGGGIHQIISGSMGGTKIANLGKGDITAMGGQIKFEGQYAHPKEGFAVLNYFENGTSTVTFVTSEGEKTLAVTPPLPKDPDPLTTPNNIQNTIVTPVTANEDKTNKTGFYNFIWGKRYRSYFGKPVTAKVGILENLYEGLEVAKAGGGHQSYSARLRDAEGRDYALRGLEKNALKFLKFKVKGIAYTDDDYEGTFAEEVVYDFFSTTHPFMQLVIYPLAQAGQINHANTQLYYVPKQKGFEILDDAYGDGLYYIEERPNTEQKDFVGYNAARPNAKGEVVNDESTTDVLEKLKEDEKYTIDQKAYLRARIFDMLIGDWDRHEDQWRWLAYEQDNEDIEFVPVPRDRDAAFSKFDGIAIPIIQLFLPDVRFWQSYASDIKNVKWFNGEGNNLDRAFINKYGVDTWVEEATFLKNNITDDIVEEAFLRLPIEVQDENSEAIKENFKARLQNLPEIAKRYAEYLNQTVSVHGTNKDDKFTITRLPQGKTKVVIERKLKDEKNEVIFDRTFNASETDEIWLYGLDDKDEFEIQGGASAKTMIRIIGGYGKDTYTVTNRSKLKVYDWKHEESTFDEKTPAKQLTNKYETNTFHWRYFKENNNILVPSVGFRTDDGLFIGASDTYTNYGFNGNPFRYQHSLTANYYFDFQAIELDYLGTFANVFPNVNLEIGGYFTNNGYAKNFFGFGNDTQYDDDAVERDFNRARTKQLKGSLGIAGKYAKIKALFESYEVDRDTTRFLRPGNVSPAVFENQNYAGAEASVAYKNQDAADFPTKALYLGATLGYKGNLDLEDNTFGYASATIGFQQKLIPSGNLVFGTTVEGKTNFGDDYFFYHAPSLGGNNGLRGFRDERFTGKTYFYQSSDLKVRLARIVTAVVPITIGAYGGFDYGRVWLDNDTSDTWHTSTGGGVWVSGLNSLALNLGYFVSDEDQIIQVGFGFGF
ncbi:ShlB/FhaC/HecB family hemolysin secretion/activation protein [Cochleicola gelatinilyticus]|uniref:Haemolysin activator HlyB C-terminal domain-containing protein n=1 Tax=Cochleicola gelatinilyticus TaxID=1763537 RepID=A0A167K796_9FLAO|nr:hypothetical protein [Cochleicola gelatinilyticus]OAB81460.1 hypothetical protein ULVI_01160 [Cochleicola gelatinilyticus]